MVLIFFIANSFLGSVPAKVVGAIKALAFELPTFQTKIFIFFCFHDKISITTMKTNH
jgi:hypothetical protein